jgi:hypothetical protein
MAPVLLAEVVQELAKEGVEEVADKWGEWGLVQLEIVSAPIVEQEFLIKLGLRVILYPVPNVAQ